MILCLIDFWLDVGCLERETNRSQNTIIDTYEHDMPVALRLTARKVTTTNRFQISPLSLHFTFRQKPTIKSMNQSVFPHLHFLLCAVSYILVFATACPHVRERWWGRYPTASPCPFCIRFDMWELNFLSLSFAFSAQGSVSFFVLILNISFFSLLIFSLKLTSGHRDELNTIWSADIIENVLGANMIESLLTFYIQFFSIFWFFCEQLQQIYSVSQVNLLTYWLRHQIE